MTTSRRLATIALIGNVIIWGAALPLIKPALSHVSPYQFLFLRYFIAAPLMLPLMFVLRPQKLTVIKKYTLIESFQIILQLTLLYEGLRLTTSLEASLLNATAPVLITLGGIYFLKEIEEKNEWRGLWFGIFGSLLIILTPLISGQESLGFSHLGNTLVLASVMAWTIYVLLAKKFYNSINKLFVAGLSCWLGLIFFGTITTFTHGINSTLDLLFIHPSVLYSSLYMGILGSPVAVALYLYGQSKIEASEATIFSYLAPLVYIPLAVFWLKEPLLPLQLIGLIVITTGVIIAQKRSLPSKIPDLT